MEAQIIRLNQKAMDIESPTAALDESLDRLTVTVAQAKDRLRFDKAREREEALMIALRSLVDCRSTPTWLKSADQGRMLYINPAYTRMFGITYEIYGGHRDNELWHDAVASVFCENDQKVLECGAEMEFDEWVTVNGDRVLYRVRKWPVVLDGVVLGIAGELLGPANERD